MSRKVYYEGDWVTVAGAGQSFDFPKTPVYPAASASPIPLSVTLPFPTAAHLAGRTAWTQIIASTTADIDFLTCWIVNAGSASDPGGCLMDIAIGAASSEVAIVEGMAMLYTTTSTTSAPVAEIPIHIPAGSRVSVRFQISHPTVLTTPTITFQYMAFGSTGEPAPSTLPTISTFNTATTTGTDLGSASNTFVQVVASTAANYKGIVMSFTSNDPVIVGATITADLGVGASFGTVMASNVLIVPSSSESFTTYGIAGGSNWIKQFIPAGSRLGVRWRVSSGSSVDNIQCVLFGVPV